MGRSLRLFYRLFCIKPFALTPSVTASNLSVLLYGVGFDLPQIFKKRCMGTVRNLSVR